MNSFLKGASRFLGWILIIIAFFLILLVPAGVYMVLAGGPGPGDTLGSFAVYLWPITALLFGIAVVVDTILRSIDKNDHQFKPGWWTLAFAIFFFAPVLMNGVSELSSILGFEVLSEIIYGLRWRIQLMMVVAAILVFGGKRVFCLLTTYLQRKLV